MKNSLFVKIMCFVLAGLMVLGTAVSLILILFQ